MLVGQYHQRIGLDQVRHQRPQRVVVAELDFVVDDGVVLVDDRHHAQAQQREQRGARVQVAFAVGQVGVRQQHLGAAQSLLAQLGLVHLDQAHLTDGGSGLQLVDFVRASGPAQALHALGNGATGNHDDFARRAVGRVQRAHQRRHLAAPFADRNFVQATALVGDQAGADLDDDAARIAQQGR